MRGGGVQEAAWATWPHAARYAHGASSRAPPLHRNTVPACAGHRTHCATPLQRHAHAPGSISSSSLITSVVPSLSHAAIVSAWRPSGSSARTDCTAPDSTSCLRPSASPAAAAEERARPSRGAVICTQWIGVPLHELACMHASPCMGPGCHALEQPQAPCAELADAHSPHLPVQTGGDPGHPARGAAPGRLCARMA